MQVELKKAIKVRQWPYDLNLVPMNPGFLLIRGKLPNLRRLLEEPKAYAFLKSCYFTFVSPFCL